MHTVLNANKSGDLLASTAARVRMLHLVSESEVAAAVADNLTVVAALGWDLDEEAPGDADDRLDRVAHTEDKARSLLSSLGDEVAILGYTGKEMLTLLEDIGMTLAHSGGIDEFQASCLRVLRHKATLAV